VTDILSAGALSVGGASFCCAFLSRRRLAAAERLDAPVPLLTFEATLCELTVMSSVELDPNPPCIHQFFEGERFEASVPVAVEIVVFSCCCFTGDCSDLRCKRRWLTALLARRVDGAGDATMG